jgi:hypothetical protein
MVQPPGLREQGERCRRLARGCIDENLRDNLPELAEEYLARAVVLENGQGSVADAGPDDRDA